MKTRTRQPSTSRSLSSTLALAFLALSVIVLIISGGLQVVSNIANQQEAVAGKLQLIAREASQPVSSFIQDKFSVLKTAIRLTNLTTVPAVEQQRILDGLLGRDLAFRQVTVMNTQGQELARSSRLSQQAARNLADQISSDALAQIEQGQPYIGSVYVDALTSEPLVLMALSVTNALGDFQGILAAEVNLKFMWDLVDALEVGDNGVAFVVDKQGNLIAFNDTARVLRGENVAHLGEVGEFVESAEGIDRTLAELSSGIQGTTVVGTFAPLGTPDWAVVVEVPWDEAYSEVIRNGIASGVNLLIMAVLAGLLGVYVARRLAVPLVSLTDTASRISAGELDLKASVSGPREVGTLAAAFNAMTERLRAVIGSLEDRVAARTEQLRASADVGRAAASTLDTDLLLSQIVNLIVDRFGLYYAAVFTVDETGQTAVLREATGEAGRELKEKRHRLQVGGNSMVGTAVVERKARIALDVGNEAVRFANPLLPDTRSEIALPLLVGDRVLGALDVQSTQAAAFDEASAAVLQSMADQIAVALSNAEQFRQTSIALQRAENLAESIRSLVDAGDAQEIGQYLARYANTLVAANRTAVYIVDHDRKEISAQAAAGYVADQDDITYELLNSGISGLVFRSGQPVLSLSADDGIEPAETRERRVQNGTGALIVVPLVAQTQVIGTVTVSNLTGQRLFDQSDVDLLMTLAAQATSAIEKLRLFEQARRALSDLDAVNRRLTGEAWNDFTLRSADTGTRWVGTADRAQQAALPEVSEALAAGQIATRPQNGSGQLGIAVPIKVRDVSIGALRLVVPQTAWTDELRTTLDSIAGHVAQAAENARLIEQTERAAQREKAIAGAADKIHRSTELDAVLHTAINEINRITGLSGVSVQLGFGQRTATAGHHPQPGKAGGE